MDGNFDAFNETTDIYLEILREAQRIEDRKLIGLIRSRLRDLKDASYMTTHGCQIIMFPRSAPSVLPPIQDGRFWPRFAYSQIAAIVLIYILLILGNSFVS